MVKVYLRYARYALTILATVGFGFPKIDGCPLNAPASSYITGEKTHAKSVLSLRPLCPDDLGDGGLWIDRN